MSKSQGSCKIFRHLPGINCKEVQTGAPASRRKRKLNPNRPVMSRGWTKKGRAIADPALDEQPGKSPRVRYLKGCSKSCQPKSHSQPVVRNPAASGCIALFSKGWTLFFAVFHATIYQQPCSPCSQEEQRAWFRGWNCSSMRQRRTQQ